MPVGANIGGVGDAIGPQQWFQSLPIITQYWFGSSIIVTLAGNLGMVAPLKLIFYWPAIRYELQVWRLITPFLYVGPFSFPTVIACYMMVNFSKQYEAGGPYNTGAGGGTADYAFMMLFGMILTLLTYPLMAGIVPPAFSHNLIFYVLYVWSKRNPDANANIYGIPVKGMYLPFAYLGLTIVMGNSYVDMVYGMAIGHFYYFLVDVVPQIQGKDILVTPQILIDHFGIGEYQPPARGAAPVMRAPAAGAGGAAAAAGGGYQWGGGGRPLGRE